MKVIIAGGRDFKRTKKDCDLLLNLHKKYNFTEVVSGEAPGADKFGESFAKFINIPIKPFPALWNDLTKEPCKIKKNRYGYEYNALAGFNRNEQMASYAEAVILFPGGSGTEDMWERSVKHGLKIIHDANNFKEMS